MANTSKTAKRKTKLKAAEKARRTREHIENLELKKCRRDAEVLEPTLPLELLLPFLDEALLDARGQLRILPGAAYDSVPLPDIRVWCNRRAVYGLPTHELIEWLLDFIGDRSAIEIGSGNGALGRALDIPRTDSRIQEDPEVAMLYRLQGQPTVIYGEDVEKLEALDAVRKYEPQVVIGSWVTNWVDPHKAFKAGSGSVYGVKERELLALPSVEAYIVVGHTGTHGPKPIMQLPHATIQEPWIRSRTRDPSGNAIFVWGS